MSTEYVPTDIPLLEKDWVRFETSDTDMAAPFLQDEEIDAQLTIQATPQKAALKCMYLIHAKKTLPSFRIGEIQVTPTAIAAKEYAKFIDEKEKEYGLSRASVGFSSETVYTVRKDNFYGTEA